MSDERFRLDGRPAIVVGAGSGIGRAIAIGFAAAGARVGCFDISESGAKATMQDITSHGGTALAIACDITDAAKVEAAVAQFVAGLGAPRVLVNGAAANDRSGTIMDLPPEEWARVLAVNLTGPYLMSRAVLPHMIGAGGGSIIHIASQLGRVAAAGRPAYCTSKGALIQLAKAMAADHAGQNIRVNTLSPGAVETPRMILRWGDMEAARRAAGPLHLVKRLGLPEEIADAALFLASDASRFMTGADLLVDGGYTAV